MNASMIGYRENTQTPLPITPLKEKSLERLRNRFNRPFYQYGGHTELIRFKEYYRMPRGHERDPIYSLSIHMRLLGQFFFEFSQKKIVMRKKARCAVFGCNNDRLFPKKKQWSFFCPKSLHKYWTSAPGHPIILLKSNEFNMATVSVKRSIYLSYIPVATK